MKEIPAEPTHGRDPILAAIKALDARKLSSGVQGGMAREKEARITYLGLGLDFDELQSARFMIGATVLEALREDFPDLLPLAETLIPFVLALWMDGLVTGIILEEHRELANRASPSRPARPAAPRPLWSGWTAGVGIISTSADS